MKSIGKSPILPIFGLVARSYAGAPYCLAGDSCFPSKDVLAEFNNTIDGRLIESKPYAAACYEADFNAEECQAIAENKGIHAWRLPQPAVVMYSNFEQNENLEGCIVPDLSADGTIEGPVPGVCTLGNMPSYVVNATNADDIAAAVKFSAEHNLRFRIKNTGHCYSGRSSGEGALSVWTHFMNDAEYIEDFVPTGTELPSQGVISAGPGVSVEGLYAAGAENGVVTIGGYTPSVGAAGGYIVGGGTGPLGAYYGLGVDNVVQYDVVTADGSQKVANAEVNPELFWSLRGGGGTFGVVHRVYIKTYPAFEAVNAVGGKIGCQDSESYAELISNLIDLQVPVRNDGHVGIWQSFASANNMALLSVKAFQEGPVESANKTREAFNSILNVEGCSANFSAAQFTGSASWNDAYLNVVFPTIEDGAIVGGNLADLSRIISYDLINDPEGRERIKEHILTSVPPVIWQNSVGEAATKVAPDATSVNPAWRNAFAFVNEPVRGPWDGVNDDMLEVVANTTERVNALFGEAAYYNEEFPFTEDWQQLLFGDNYPRLLKNKKELDPNGVFSCTTCPGSEDGV